MKNIVFKIVVLLTVSFMATDLSAQSFEMENATLSGYQASTFTTASGGNLVALTSTFGSAKVTVSTEIGVKDLKVTYAYEATGNSVFEVYISEKLVDAWYAHDYFTVVTEGTTAIVTHTTKNVTLVNGDVIEIVGYKSGTELALLDKLDITATVADSTSFSLSEAGTINTIVLNGEEYISGASSMSLRAFSGSSLSEDTLNGGTVTGDAVSLKDASNYQYADYIFRTEKFQNHVRLKLIGLDKVPKNDNSFSLRVTVPYTSGLSYAIIDTENTIAVTNASNVITIDWTQLATRGLTPGGYIAFYPTELEEEALAEIASTPTLKTLAVEPDLPSTISVFPNPFTNSVTIESSDLSLSKVEVFNTIGQVIASEKGEVNQMTLDLNNVTRGVYIVKITSGYQVYSQKVIKE